MASELWTKTRPSTSLQRGVYRVFWSQCPSDVGQMRRWTREGLAFMSKGAIRSPHQILALWNRWVTPRSTERDEQFRERTIRGSIVVISIVALAIAIVFILSDQPDRLYQPVILLVFPVIAAWAVQHRHLLTAGWILVLLGIVFAV